MTIRDKFALQRTSLANQRTFLSYLRTSLFFFVAGITLTKLQPSDYFLKIVATLFLMGSVFMLMFGVFLFRRVKSSLSRNR